MFGWRLYEIRTLSALRRRLGLAAIETRPLRGMGQLLHYALSRSRRSSEMGLERRGLRLDRDLFRPAKAMGTRRRM